MKFLIDLFPVFLFFITFKLGELFPAQTQELVTTYLGGFISGHSVTQELAPVLLATSIAIIASLVQVAYLKARGRKIDAMLWMSVASITVFGSLTIYFHDKNFIMWKPTVLYWAFAVGMLVSQLGFSKNIMRETMESQIKLPDEVWNKLGFAYILFFTAYGCLNLLAAFVVFKDNFDSYATFKAFGMPAIFFVFIVFQTIYLSRHLQDEA